MSDIHIHRSHQLGLGKARELARQWAQEAETKFDMSCKLIEGDSGDTVEFTRSGVSGHVIVAADHFDLTAKLSFLLSGFSKTIESEIEKNLDKLLARHAPASQAGANSNAPSA